jgi:protein phosphatase PTC1
VICRNGKAVRLSKDHKAEDPDETARIIKNGGFVFEQRVAGVLAVARSDLLMTIAG